MVRDEKRRATVVGVVAASFLTSIKLVAGILSNSLAVLAEAAHSALDLASAVGGFFAIRASDKPADREHTYGHGKADTLGGLFAALLLLVTCFWIMLEGAHRLIIGHVALDVTVITFIVIAVSIAVDSERTYVFRRIGRRTGSPTIQGESLHFASDIASSVAVLSGLFFVIMGYVSVDTYLALGIAMYFLYTSVKLMVARINELLDRVPSELRDQIERVAGKVRRVRSVDRVRVRKSGIRMFVDLVVSVDPRTPFVASHAIASEVEKAIGAKFKDSDVLVHVNPSSPREEITDKIREIALEEGAAGVHAVDIESYGEDLHVGVHLEFASQTSLRKAHSIASKIESRIRKLSKVTSVITHIEPEKQQEGALRTESRKLVDRIRQLALSQKCIESCHDIYLAKVGSELHVSMHCTFVENLTVRKVHELSTILEEAIIRDVEGVADVTIHPEPRTQSHTRP